MIAHCPKLTPYPCGGKLIWQPSRQQYWCPKCKLNWTFKQAHLRVLPKREEITL